MARRTIFSHRAGSRSPKATAAADMPAWQIWFQLLSPRTQEGSGLPSLKDALVQQGPGKTLLGRVLHPVKQPIVTNGHCQAHLGGIEEMGGIPIGEAADSFHFLKGPARPGRGFVPGREPGR